MGIEMILAILAINLGGWWWWWWIHRQGAVGGGAADVEVKVDAPVMDAPVASGRRSRYSEDITHKIVQKLAAGPLGPSRMGVTGDPRKNRKMAERRICLMRLVKLGRVVWVATGSVAVGKRARSVFALVKPGSRARISAEYLCLMCVATAPGAVKNSEIRAVCRLGTEAMRQGLAALLAAGYIRSSSSGRSPRYEITAGGCVALMEMGGRLLATADVIGELGTKPPEPEDVMTMVLRVASEAGDDGLWPREVQEAGECAGVGCTAPAAFTMGGQDYCASCVRGSIAFLREQEVGHGRA